MTHEGAVHARHDAVSGVSECIIVGAPIPLGTGMFKVLYKHSIKPTPLDESRKLFVLDYDYDRQASTEQPVSPSS